MPATRSGCSAHFNEQGRNNHQSRRSDLARAADRPAGRRYGASEAVAAGIVHQVASEDQVLARAVQVAAELAAKNRRTLAEHKRMLDSEAIEVIDAPQCRNTGAARRHWRSPS